jgi:hypothetical protein
MIGGRDYLLAVALHEGYSRLQANTVFTVKQCQQICYATNNKPCDEGYEGYTVTDVSLLMSVYIMFHVSLFYAVVYLQSVPSDLSSPWVSPNYGPPSQSASPQVTPLQDQNLPGPALPRRVFRHWAQPAQRGQRPWNIPDRVVKAVMTTLGWVLCGSLQI